jgi:metal-dependent amidase/aminoacylase/carboxypeptidase family protein
VSLGARIIEDNKINKALQSVLCESMGKTKNKTEENFSMSNDFKESMQCFGWCLIIFGSVLLVEVLVS